MTQYLFMSAVNKPQSLQLNNKYISYPYINPNNTTDGVYELLVDIEDEEKTNIFTVSLKCAYSQFYPNYQQYLNENDFHSLDERIRSYYDDIIKTKIVYKYKRGQFGYISLTKASNLEQTFVIIEDLSKCVREISFVHDELEKYKYTHYDITSPKPKILTPKTSGWIIESLFSPIDDTIDITNDATKDLIQLLNWKICREDYLLKKMMRMKMEIELRNNNNMNNNYDTTTDDDETSYAPVSDTGESSSCYTSTDIENDSTDITNIDIEENGYIFHKDLGYTLRGELFVALDMNINKNKNKEPVAIKKMASDGFRIAVNTELIKETLILRDLKTENKWIKNSMVKYRDFFQGSSHFYIVMELSFSVNLKEFVVTAHKYVKYGQLNLIRYKGVIKYLLWKLTALICWLHNDMNCCDLDICPENIMLNGADFMKNSDDSIEIASEIDMKFIDFSVGELLRIGNCDKIKQFKSKYNTKYLLLKNEQYASSHDGRLDDMWSFGMVIYFCFFGDYPYNVIPETDDDKLINNGYLAVKNGKLKEYLAMKNRFKFINIDVLSLIVGLLNIDGTKRLNIINVLKHKWFKSFHLNQ